MPLNRLYGPLPLTETVDPGRRAGDNTKALRAAATFERVCPACGGVWNAYPTRTRPGGNAYCPPCGRARSLAYMAARRLRLAAMRKAARHADRR